MFDGLGPSKKLLLLLRPRSQQPTQITAISSWTKSAVSGGTSGREDSCSASDLWVQRGRTLLCGFAEGKMTSFKIISLFLLQHYIYYIESAICKNSTYKPFLVWTTISKLPAILLRNCAQEHEPVAEHHSWPQLELVAILKVYEWSKSGQLVKKLTKVFCWKFYILPPLQ